MLESILRIDSLRGTIDEGLCEQVHPLLVQIVHVSIQTEVAPLGKGRLVVRQLRDPRPALFGRGCEHSEDAEQLVNLGVTLLKRAQKF